MNTDEQQIDFGLEHLSDLAKGEFGPADYPGAMSAVVSKVLEAFVSSGRQARMMKLNQDTFALQWIEPHPEALSYDEFIELEYGGQATSFLTLTKTQRAEIAQLLRRQEKMLPSRDRELLLSRKEALLLLTAFYMPSEFLGDVEAALR